MHAEVLRNVSILRELTDEELSALSALLKVVEIPEKTRIIQEGTIVTEFSFITEGVVHVRRLAKKREMLLGRLGVGAFFGEINLFDPSVATASLYAMKPVKLAVVDYVTLRAFLAAHPQIGYKVVSAMMGEMARRLRQTSSRLANSYYWSAEEALKGAVG